MSTFSRIDGIYQFEKLERVSADDNFEMYYNIFDHLLSLIQIGHK